MIDFLKEKDKQKHILVTIVIAVVGAIVAGIVGHDLRVSILSGFLTAMAVGIGKEIYDSRKGGTGFSTKDILADAIGASIGVLIFSSLTYIS